MICPLSVLRLVWGLSRIIHYRINTAAVNVRKANIQILRVKGILAQSFFALWNMHCTVFQRNDQTLPKAQRPSTLRQ